MSPELTSLDRVLGGVAEEKLINQFFVLYKNARIIEENNPTFTNQARALHQQLLTVAEARQSVVIKIISARYFVNGQLTRYDDRGMSGAATVVAEWNKLGLAGIVFDMAITSEQIGRFFKFMAEVRPDQDNLEELSDRLKDHGLPHINLLSVDEADEDADVASKAVRMQFRASARNTFFRAMSTVEQTMLSAVEENEAAADETKRIVHALIEHITRDESSMIELTAIKNFDDYTYAHSTNVCVYALTLGLRLGMDYARLSQLGFAALFHDMGKVRLSGDLVRKPDAFDENDWLQMQRHPHWGTKLILRNLRLDVHSARAARAAFEHHINQDFTGYPVLKRPVDELNLFSRIISIVDTFDALSSGRVYMKQKFSPDEALRKMHFQMGVKFEPFLFKIFNSIVGIYPAGSLVLLSSEEIALVLANNEEHPTKPYIKIVGDRQGILSQARWLDLSQPEAEDRSILRVIDPERYGLNIRDFVLND
jgi:HD-GYP domain-containing protein (c-di-GMP phosphodiesterase class II)